MIIYGTKTSHLRTEPVPVPCPACASPEALHLSVFGRYAHIYWVPLVPLGKIGQSACGHCQQVVPAKQLSPNLKQHLDALKRAVKTPWWHFAGLLLAVVAVGCALVFNSARHRENRSFVQQPHQGDLYHVRTENGNYSLLKVQEVGGNTVRLLPNNYQINKSTQLKELDKPENFAKEPIELTLLDLQIMLEKDEIVDVERL